jgi:hypothetical protein
MLTTGQAEGGQPEIFLGVEQLGDGIAGIDFHLNGFFHGPMESAHGMLFQKPQRLDEFPRSLAVNAVPKP